MTFSFFFFNDTATTEIYTLSLHDALPICGDDVGTLAVLQPGSEQFAGAGAAGAGEHGDGDRKSTRLNSSHLVISYAVFCLKKKQSQPTPQRRPAAVCYAPQSARGRRTCCR